VEATYNGTVAQLSVELQVLENELDDVRTSVDTQFVNTDVTLPDLSTFTLGGIAPPLSHLQVPWFLMLHRAEVDSFETCYL